MFSFVRSLLQHVYIRIGGRVQAGEACGGYVPAKGKNVVHRIYNAVVLTTQRMLWYRFFDYAAADWCIVPRDIMEDEEVVKVLPVLFRMLRCEKPSEEELNRWGEMLRTA